MLKELLNEGTKASMMRFTVLLTLGIFVLFSFVLSVVILYKTFKCEVPDWVGLSLFFGVLALNVFTVAGVKAYQKKFETKKE